MALGERGRNPFLPRSTAETAAALRAAGALEPDRAVRCPDKLAGRFLGGFNVTTLAKRPRTRTVFVALVERKVPGAYAYEVARAKVLDEIILAELEAGLDELVLLGAGLDSRPYRLEIGFRASRSSRSTTPPARPRNGRGLGESWASPRHGCISCPWTSPSTMSAPPWRAPGTIRAPRRCSSAPASRRITHAGGGGAAGLDRGAPFSADVGGLDAMWASVLDGNSPLFGARELCNAVKDVGEPLRWGFPDGQVEQTLARMGLRAERILDADALAAYVARADGSLLARPYGFRLLVHARPT